MLQITSPEIFAVLVPVKLLLLTALGYIFHSIQK
jgi:hypothetical protein